MTLYSREGRKTDIHLESVPVPNRMSSHYILGDVTVRRSSSHINHKQLDTDIACSVGGPFLTMEGRATLVVQDSNWWVACIKYQAHTKCQFLRDRKEEIVFNRRRSIVDGFVANETRK